MVPRVGEQGPRGQQQIQGGGGEEARRGQGRGQGAGGGRSTLPQEILRMMRRKASAKVVAMDFGGFLKIPEPAELHRWLKELGLLTQVEEVKKIDWVGRNEYERKVLVHMKEMQGAEWLEQDFSGGKDWTDQTTGTIIKIRARWEGQLWKDVVIRGINPQTLVTKVSEVFAEYGEVRKVSFLEMDGVRYDQASLQVRVREDAELPVFIFAQARGADTGQEEMERWELNFRGRPRVCFSCFRTGHLRQRCPQGVTFEALSASEGVRGTYARVVKGPQTQEQLDAASRRQERAAEELRLQEESDTITQGGANMAPVLRIVANVEGEQERQQRQEEQERQQRQEEQERLQRQVAQQLQEEQDRQKKLQEEQERKQKLQEEQERKQVLLEDEQRRELEEQKKFVQDQEKEEQLRQENVRKEKKIKLQEDEREQRERKRKEAKKVDLCSLASCSKPGGRRCTGCRTVSYCSYTCQKQDWKEGHQTTCKEVGWERSKKDFDKREAERQREAEEEQHLDDIEMEKFRHNEKERGRKRQLASPRTGLPESHRSRTSESNKSRKSSHRRRSRSGARLSQDKSLGNEAATPPVSLNVQYNLETGIVRNMSDRLFKSGGAHGTVKRTVPPASHGSAPTLSTAKKVARGNKDQELVAGDWANEMNRESLEEDVRSTSGALTIGSKGST
jgi:hypothetical protein